MAVLVLWALIRSPLARHFGDQPDHRKVHQAVVPRIGGLGIVLAFLAILGIQAVLAQALWPHLSSKGLKSFLFTALFLMGAGVLDDVKTIGFKLKFLLQFSLAGILVMLMGHHFDTVTILGHRLDLGGLGPLLSIFWIVAVMNALNIVDGIDGLAAGAALIGFTVVGFMAHGVTELVALCLVLMGVTAGFLRFNFSRTHKMFLGDTGSQFLGATLALLAIQVQDLPRTGSSIFVPLLIVGYPLFDITVAMVRRFMCGHRKGLGVRILRMFVADNEHLHHRLVYLGMSHLQSTFLLLMVAGGIGATAVIITRIGWPYKPMVMGYLAVTLILILNRLGFIGLNPWLTVPRTRPMPGRIVGVIEPDDVFMHSLTHYRQDDFGFLGIPGKATQLMSGKPVAVILYNGSSDRFEEMWTRTLRVTEVQDCPAVVIAEAKDIERVKTIHPEGFRSVHFMEKPLHIPELIRKLDGISRPSPKSGSQGPRERKFNLAEIVRRNRRKHA